MKTFAKTLAAIITIATMAISFSNAQTPPPPNGGNSPGSNNKPVGGGAPIGDGLLMMAFLGASYGAKKMYPFKKRNFSDD
jgi:hypothetical protein